MELNTFSIVARCPRTHMLGAAVSTAVPAVGAVCPRIVPGVGAACTQSWTNPYLAIDALARVRDGEAAGAALDAVLAGDAARDVRQIGIVDAAGRSAAFSGAACTDWFGHVTGPGYAIQGNMLAGPGVIASMEKAFVASEASELAERMLLALEAAQAAGGDKRGKQSAALIVYGTEEYPFVDLRVDEHRHPVAELRRIWPIFQAQSRPFIAGMPRRGQPAMPAPDSVRAILAIPPPYRPGGGGSET
jgi:uncharacterized Ntn-hydrolase superfamily protein